MSNRRLTRRGLIIGAAALTSYHSLADGLSGSVTPQSGGGIGLGFDGGINGGGTGIITPIGGLLSLTIADATPIDPQSSIGASGSGWVAIVKLKGLTSLVGTVVPSALTLSVNDPGYDTSGNVTTVSRTITGVAHLRRQYPNGDSKMISTNGIDLTLYVSLDDWIYSGTTLVSASIGGTFYPSCTAGNATSKSNLSAIAYTKPLFGWINPQQERSGSTFATESVAFHRHARNGSQVACIKYSANDGTTTSPVVTVAATALSSKITRGQVPEVWKATVDMSTLSQGVMSTVNAKVYPWIGDSSAVLDLSVDGVTWPTSLPITQLRVLNDRTGGYGGGFAYVQVGAVGGTSSNVAATAAAAPYPTVSAAVAGLAAWNNTNRSHNDLGGGTIRLMDTAGANTTHTINSAVSNSPGSCWCELEKDPASPAVITVQWGSQQATPQLMRWRNLTILSTAGSNFNILGDDSARSLICADNCVFDNTIVKTHVAWFAMKYFYNLTLIGTCQINGLPSATANLAICAGIDATAGSSSGGLPIAKLIIGCKSNQSGATGGEGPIVDSSATGDGDHGRIVYNNAFWRAQFENSASAKTINFGFANVQNIYETSNFSSNAICMNYFADGDRTTIGNYIEFHNTAVGERCSRLYNDIVTTKVIPNGVVKMGSSRYSIWDNYNCKTDTFNLDGAGSVGNWSYCYSVGNRGNVCLFGDVTRLAAQVPVNAQTGFNYLAMAWLPSSEANLFRTALGFTQANIMDMFTNYTTAPRASPTKGGDYTPKNTSTLFKSRVPAGESVLTYDFAGVLRKTDGTGAAGALEAAP